MKTTTYNKLISNLVKLNRKEFKNLKTEIKKIDDKKKVANILEYKDYVTCGHCGSTKHVKHGIRNDLQRYKCRKCGKTFNQLTGTPLARLRKKGRWFTYSECLNKGYTLIKSALVTEISESTSFRWRHRLLKNLQDLQPKGLNGVVESCETYFRYSEKGRRNPSEMAIEVNKNAPKVYVVSNRDRNRNISNQILFELKSELVDPNLTNLIAKDILYISNNQKFYNDIAQSYNLRHGSLDSKKGEVVKKQIVHLKNIKDYNERLHDWMKRFRGVATKYLINYLGWFRELDEHTMSTPIKTRLIRAKSIATRPYQPKIE
jgi:transposase-like protein